LHILVYFLVYTLVFLQYLQLIVVIAHHVFQVSPHTIHTLDISNSKTIWCPGGSLPATYNVHQ